MSLLPEFPPLTEMTLFPDYFFLVLQKITFLALTSVNVLVGKINNKMGKMVRDIYY